MSTYFECQGCVQVDPSKPGFAEAVNKIEDWLHGDIPQHMWDQYRFEFDEKTNEIEVYVSDYFSYSSMGEFQEMMKEFFGKYTLEPSTLECEAEGEKYDYDVGPKGYDMRLYTLSGLEFQIEQLTNERDKLKAAIAAGPPVTAVTPQE